MHTSARSLLALTLTAALGACTPAADEVEAPNPFLEDQYDEGKEDTAYLNPDGIEVEVDLEADVEGSEYRIWDGPAELGQFALTYLRKRGEVYLESLAEDATSDQRAEWLIDGSWKTAAAAKQIAGVKPKRFRLRGVNAVLLHSASKDAKVGQILTARVPIDPFSMMGNAGDTCADPDGHIGLSSSVYWYLFNPEKEGCTTPMQEMTVAISKVLPVGATVYPEYDRLLKDKKLTIVVLFGQIGDGAISEWDAGMTGSKQMGRWLEAAGYKEVTPAPLGRRFTKTLKKSKVTVEFDLYSPHEFSGLGDHGHFANFQKALSEHEIVIYDGHSMLGASDFWSRPTYPDLYQIFMYGGCLGYEYYVRPIVAGKKGWQNVDILSSVVEVSASANDFAAPALAKLIASLETTKKASWKSLLGAVRTGVGDSTFGVSGVRDNCYTPSGSRCK
ncbi:MAG: hypothetical protein QG573_1310 [Acidobacteriota bacterium]|nr:hypothetical protein [Acidobacteriota bacterium]